MYKRIITSMEHLEYGVIVPYPFINFVRGFIKRVEEELYILAPSGVTCRYYTLH